MIQVVCCDHIVTEPIKHNVPFKFATKFGQCDFSFHKAILVGKCHKNDFLISSFTVEKKCTCTKQFTCYFCLVRLFILNQLAHKICLSDKWMDSKLLSLDTFLENICCKKNICKFIYNPIETKCEHITL